MSSVTYNRSELRTFRRQLGELEAARVKVGLLGSTSGRVADPGRIADNPSLGAVHEFGLSFSKVSDRSTTTIPARSFLRMPLMTQLGPTLLRGGINWVKMLRKRGAKRTLAFLGAVAEDVIQEAFATAGFGQWAQLKPSTIRRKDSAAILIESAQLRKAITSEVVV